jgi:hypothetical protein
VLGFRPRGTAEPVYIPQHSIALVFPDLARQVYQHTQPGYFPDWLRGVAESFGVTQAELDLAHERYMVAVEEFLNPAHGSLDEALKASGYWSVPDAAKVIHLSSLGSQLTGWAFACMREAHSIPWNPKYKLCVASPQEQAALRVGHEVLKQEGRL